MVRPVCLLFGAAAVLLSLVNPLFGWIFLAIPGGYLWWMLRRVRHLRPQQNLHLSPLGQDLVNRYGHFYAIPWAGESFGGGASILALSSLILGAVNIMQGFWWGIGLALLGGLVFGNLARNFNPTRYLSGIESEVHHEILNQVLSGSTITARRNEAEAQASSSVEPASEHVIYSCINCPQRVRLPQGKGKIKLTCPKCDQEQYTTT
jgi:hypothetical protein